MIRFSKLMIVTIVFAMVISLVACAPVTTPNNAPPADTKVSTGGTGQEQKPAEKVKIKFLSLSADENRNNIRENYIKVNVEKEFPNVEVEYDLGGGGQDYANKLKAYNASGDMPDVWFSRAKSIYCCYCSRKCS